MSTFESGFDFGGQTMVTKVPCSIHQTLSEVKDILTTFFDRGYMRNVNMESVLSYLIYLDRVASFKNCLCFKSNIHI